MTINWDFYFPSVSFCFQFFLEPSERLNSLQVMETFRDRSIKPNKDGHYWFVTVVSNWVLYSAVLFRFPFWLFFLWGEKTWAVNAFWTADQGPPMVCKQAAWLLGQNVEVNDSFRVLGWLGPTHLSVVIKIELWPIGK